VRDIENLGGETRFIAADVSDADDVRRLATEAGDVDILIDAAGIHGASKGAPRRWTAPRTPTKSPTP
jgi:short-subunit dehydrogenase